jgi:hypothetical protein
VDPLELTPELMSQAFLYLATPKSKPMELPLELKVLPHEAWMEILELLEHLQLEKQLSQVH